MKNKKITDAKRQCLENFMVYFGLINYDKVNFQAEHLKIKGIL